LFPGSPDFAPALISTHLVFSKIMDLSGFSIVSTDGTFVDANTCYLLDTSKLDEEQLETLNEGTDGERHVLAEEYGLGLKKALILKENKTIFCVIAYHNGGATVLGTYLNENSAFDRLHDLKKNSDGSFSYCVSISRIS